MSQQAVSLCPARVYHMLPLKLSPSESHHPFETFDLYPSSPLPLSSTSLVLSPPIRMSSPSHRPPSRSEFLLRETLLKDELQRDRERESEPTQSHHEDPRECFPPNKSLPRRACLHRSVTEGTGTLPRATSLSPTRRHHHHRSLPHPNPHFDSPYDQILRARLDKVITCAATSQSDSHSGTKCGSLVNCGCGSHSSPRASSCKQHGGKRASLPATPHGGGGGWFGWFWREDADGEGTLGGDFHSELGRGRFSQCEQDWQKRYERGTSCSGFSGLFTPEDCAPGSGGAVSDDSQPTSNVIQKRARSNTEPTALSHRLKVSSSSKSSESSARSSPFSTFSHPAPSALKTWVIPLETVYSGEDTGAEAPTAGQARDEGKGDGDGILTPPPTPPTLDFGPSKGKEPEQNRGMEFRIGHRRTMSEVPLTHSQLQSYPHPSTLTRGLPSSHRTSTTATAMTSSLSLSLKSRPRALSARVSSSSDSSDGSGSGSDPASPTSCHSLPLPPSSSSPPLDPRKFNVRHASAQCRQLEGYVSFMAIEGLGEPEGREVDGGVVGLEESLSAGKSRGRRWLLF
ncbi:hypothetical protein E1B28_000101 [Marasmius oreades]|uniref:Uncharacterized protein n=1 Tax=Marasmius oreades TaxID=181124 RepID=A0A9P8AE91_9AGAR|nr:uncharacterized protein E1B28_000101 [Marasmius oreades]KAG7098130.1 hypothetical protein E1B28_000101 [Marasmius oreades]